MSKINCRLCNADTKNGLEIYGPEGVKLSIAKILNQHFTLQFVADDIFSKIICKKCWKITDQFHNLYCAVQEIETKLQVNVDENGVLLTAIDQSIYYDIKQENDLVEEDSKPDSIIGCIVEADNVKFEDLFNETGDDSFGGAGGHLLNGARKSNKMLKKKLRIGQRDLKGQSEKCIKVWASKAEVQEQEETICNELAMICDICNKKTTTYQELKSHIRLNHNVPGYIRCCNQKFFRRGRLYAHIRDHNSFGLFKCDKCDKIFIDKAHLDTHVNLHNPLSKKYSCSKCSRRFMAPSTLNEHLLSVHRTSDTIKSFICDICGKAFVTKKLLSSHMDFVHIQRYTFVCDICAKVYPSKTALTYHYQTLHLNVKFPKVQCTLCGIWLAHLVSLKKHMRLHEEKEETCKLCGKVAPNNHALRSHIRAVHNAQIFRCTICEKTFKSKKTLREHISSHTGNYLYKCTFCSMEFNSNANMYKHRKKMHPIEWKKDRDRRLNETSNDQKT